ncbi:MAG: pectate lyase, partial [Limisphaerales bacterium]
RYTYRKDGARAGKRNYTTFDDNKSQSALVFLMRMDEELKFRDAEIHEAVEYALRHMLAAQYPNGAWPQQFSEPADPADHPVKKASYPKAWSRKYEGKRYIGHYTLNDNNMSHIMEMMLQAYRIYGRKDCREAALKTGDFFILAQMPDPQPGWAQQYDGDMHPAWARKFEPASITGGESQSVMKSLISLYRQTGETRFLKPLPRALAYYRKSLLPDGQLARFYELRNNNPLFFTMDYTLTYSDADMPTHYSFKVGSNLDSIERAYRKALRTKPADCKPDHRPVRRERLRSSITKRGKEAIAALDSRAAWVEAGKLRYQKDLPVDRIISMRAFVKNLENLAAYVGAR